MQLRDCDFKVYRVHYTYDKIVRTSTCGGMDSEYSHTENGVNGSCLIVAPSTILARALFEHNYSRSRTFSSIEFIDEVSVMMRG
jgi:hypothetical protein